MRHLDRNQKQYPSNKDYMSTIGDSENTNRVDALHNVAPASRHPIANYERVRDEKLPNMMLNPNHATQTTVEYLSKQESNGENRPSLDHTDGGKRQQSGTNYGTFDARSNFLFSIGHFFWKYCCNGY